MYPILSVARSLGAPPVVLFADDPVHGSSRFEVAIGERQIRRPLTATDPLAAIREVPKLHLAYLDQETHFVRHRHLPSRDEILSAIRPLDIDAGLLIGPPEDSDSRFAALARSPNPWTSDHRISLDGYPVYAVRPVDDEDGYVVIDADPFDRPHENWRELVSFVGDDNGPGGPGDATSGTVGLYLVRPGVFALVADLDDSLSIEVATGLVSSAPEALIRDHLYDLAAAERIGPHLILAAYGFDADDLEPGDRLRVPLPEADIRQILADLTERA